MRNLNGKNKSAQASLEITVAFICILLLLWGCFKAFLWFNMRLAQRQERYEATRFIAGSVGSFLGSVEVDADKRPLDIFGPVE